MNLKKNLIDLFLICFSTYTPLLLYSALVNFNFGKTPHDIVEFKRRIEDDYDLQIQAANKGYKPVFFPGTILKNSLLPEIYPIGTLPYTPSYYCNEGYGLIKFSSDRFGLRNLDHKWDNIKKQSNIFVIGDSFVHGACVDDNSTITSHIERNLKGNTINLATGSNGPNEYTAILNSIIKPIINDAIQDNRVIVIFYDNDNEIKNKALIKSNKSIVKKSNKNGYEPTKTYINSISNYIKNNYALDKKEIILNLEREQNILRKKMFKFSYPYRIFTLVPIRDRFYKLFKTISISGNNQDKSITPSQNTILTLAKVCQNKCKPIVSYIPNSNYWRNNPFSKEYKKQLKEISNEMGIDFIDGENILDKNDQSNYAPKGPHLSKKGYKKFADYISDNL